jgi:hypothetical protein
MPSKEENPPPPTWRNAILHCLNCPPPLPRMRTARHGRVTLHCRLHFSHRRPKRAPGLRNPSQRESGHSQKIHASAEQPSHCVALPDASPLIFPSLMSSSSEPCRSCAEFRGLPPPLPRPIRCSPFWHFLRVITCPNSTVEPADFGETMGLRQLTDSSESGEFSRVYKTCFDLQKALYNLGSRIAAHGRFAGPFVCHYVHISPFIYIHFGSFFLIRRSEFLPNVCGSLRKIVNAS